MKIVLAVFTLAFGCLFSMPNVKLGVDVFFDEESFRSLKAKHLALVLNQTSISSREEFTLDLFKRHAGEYCINAIFTPEHGLNGAAYAGEEVDHSTDESGIPIFSLHGATRRPNDKMLKGIDVIIFDIQEIGSRSYTYATTLFYIMEEAAKRGIQVFVLDRPNPINGIIVDGPMLKEEFRSFRGYINVPYCHGMTIGELALYFNKEYRINSDLKVIKMKEWKREMSFKETGLSWMPPSPNIPEKDTPLYYATTGIIGELGIVSIGIGYTQPFKLIGAPWINAKQLAKQLNAQNLPGVNFIPYHYRPFFGLFEGKECHGVKIIVTDHIHYQPLATQYIIIGVLKSLYAAKFETFLAKIKSSKKASFCAVNGNQEMFQFLCMEKYVAWKMIQFDRKGRQEFLEKRKEYLLY
jgi:uncharacterized protein YbbC (DUF1343 family)